MGALMDNIRESAGVVALRERVNTSGCKRPRTWKGTGDSLERSFSPNYPYHTRILPLYPSILQIFLPLCQHLLLRCQALALPALFCAPLLSTPSTTLLVKSP
ncbi:hypothetical protein GOBAR_AA09365 [Gossypium barbadense]|uniref:Uncharacterized protein n=1 Tax=Gossypium barbadense TaxID=3634 RepID=A0A2P5Y6Q6_GOSBA|nr:hypothetical protein GOBAR_AA09365 [Gossypium barbadense]